MRTRLAMASCHLQGGIFRSPQRAWRETAAPGHAGHPGTGTRSSGHGHRESWSREPGASRRLPGPGGMWLIDSDLFPTAAPSVEIFSRPTMLPTPPAAGQQARRGPQSPLQELARRASLDSCLQACDKPGL